MAENLYRHNKSGRYYALFKRGGKQIRKSLKTNDKDLVWYNLACYACVLGKKFEASRRLAKAIDLGGDGVKMRALDDPGSEGLCRSGEKK